MHWLGHEEYKNNLNKQVLNIKEDIYVDLVPFIVSDYTIEICVPKPCVTLRRFWVNPEIIHNLQTQTAKNYLTTTCC